MQNILIDAGPMIALFDRDDNYHSASKKFMSEFRGNLISSWPVITETSHMLDFSVQVQMDFLEWVYRGAIRIYDLQAEHLKRIIELSKKYADIPMDLADSSLVLIAELTGIRQIITLDSDFYVYRTRDRLHIENIMAPYLFR